MADKKQLFLLCGGNGAGKSTFYRLFLEPMGIKFINADLIAKKIFPLDPEKESYKAALIAEKLRSDLLEEGISFCFETVFSHVSKIDFTARAKSLGYEVILVYIHLFKPELNEARVAQRVSEGGHNVPSQKIKTRIPRLMQNIRKALPLVDYARLLDNSSSQNPFVQIASVEKGKIKKFTDPIPVWAEEILRDL